MPSRTNVIFQLFRPKRSERHKESNRVKDKDIHLPHHQPSIQEGGPEGELRGILQMEEKPDLFGRRALSVQLLIIYYLAGERD